MPRALISVSDKRGIVQFARGLVDLGWEIISTGGTGAALLAGDVPVTFVDDVTGYPEILDGRVKTLHPSIHAALLARRDLHEHALTLEQHAITPIDLVAVNLYPFQATIAKPDVPFEDALENIDIGGPSMLRSAAKNHEFVIPVVDPQDYTKVLAMLKQGDVPQNFRRELAAKVFAHTSDYDSAIARFLPVESDGLPSRLVGAFERMMLLRYGENPGQRAALYASEEPRGIRDMSQLHGKELSFNNLLDLDGAAWAASSWAVRPACVIVKHTTPCGVALGTTSEDAFRRALATDPQSAFGGVAAFNTVVDRGAAAAMTELFLEVVCAPSFHEDAVEILATKKNLRVVELPVSRGERGLDAKQVRGGFLVQDRFIFDPSEDNWRIATTREPTDQEWNDIRFAWAAVAPVKSNGVLLAKNEMAIGIGAGQMSRVDATYLAIYKAQQQHHDVAGSVLASDGFFPFADSVVEAAKAGVTAIIQPGGSIRDAEVVAAANDNGMAMIVTGQRQFRH